MKFSEYLDKFNITPAEMAERLDTNAHVIYRLLKGKIPRPQTILKILKETKDEVSANELLGLPRKIPKNFWRKKEK